MSTTFVPPRPDQWEGPAQAGGFTPPPVDSWQGPAQPSVPGMERLGGSAPPAPKVSLPGDLDPNRATPSTFQNPRTGRIGTNVAPGHADPLTNFIDNPVVGAGRMTEGVEQMAEPGVNEKTAGASKIIRGGMQAATPLLPVAAAAAPAAVATGLVSGTAAGGVAHAGLKAMGAPEGVQDLGEDVAGIAAGGFAAKRAPGALADAKTAIAGKFARDPKTSMVKALKPTATNTNFETHLDRALPELKATEPELGRKIENIGDLIEAIEAAKKRVWAQYRGITDQPSIDPYSKQPTVGTRAEAQHDMSPVADAMEATISPKLRRENPKAARSIVNLAKKYRTPMDLQEAESILKTTNAELEGYYAKYPTAQRKALAANPQVAVKEAQASALRDTIYEALDAQGEGAAPRELKQRYGSLMNLEKEAYRRQNVANRQQPDSLSEQFGKWSGVGRVVKGVLTMNPADVAMGVAESKAAKWIKEQQTTDALIKSALASFKGSPAAVNAPAPFQPKGLLTTGDIITPPPADTSSVRSVPAMRSPPNPSRALPAASSTQVPPSPLTRPTGETIPRNTGVPGDDASAVRSLPALINPKTGMPWTAEELKTLQKGYGVPKYAKGGIIKRPTLLVDMKTRKPSGIMAEEGPEQIVPMKDGIEEQLGDLASLKRRVVMIPRGTFPRAAPEGMVTHADQSGNRFIFNPRLIGIHDVKVAIATNRLPAILGGKRPTKGQL